MTTTMRPIKLIVHNKKPFACTGIAVAVKMKIFSLGIVLLVANHASAWSTRPGLFPRRVPSLKRVSTTRHAASAAAATPEGGNSKELTPAEAKKEARRKQIKEEGGPLAFNTKYGALNPFAIYYGLTAILLGLPWLAALTFCQVLYFISGNRIDKNRRLPVFFSQIWGTVLMFLTRCTPELINYDVLERFYGKKQAAMFVANHNSWMDIPFVGYTIGWRNYKLISKAELGKVPILGKAIKEGGNVMVDRTNRRSQLKTLKDGMQWLKNGVHLCTFPEGTRSRTGRLLPFKNGAFKMAYKEGAPVIPLSIVGSGKAMPANWMFPRRPTHDCQVIIHEPISSEGKTEDELAEAVRAAVISGLPADQRPLDPPKPKPAPEQIPAPVDPAPIDPAPTPASQE